MTTLITGVTYTSGWQVTADTTGTLNIQTGSVPTSAMYIDASQNIGINTGGVSPSTSNGSVSINVGIKGTLNVNLGFETTTNQFGGIVEWRRTGRTTSARFAQFAANEDASSNAIMTWWTAAASADVTEKMRLGSAGGLSLGTTATGVAGEFRATNAVTAFYSDRRLKTEIGRIENALDKIDQLTGVIYTQNKLAEEFGYNNYDEQVGLYADDVKRVQPQVVKPAPFDLDENNQSKSGENYLTVQYEKLVPLLVEGIKELRKEINALKGQ